MGERDRQSRIESLKESSGKGDEAGRKSAAEIARGMDGATDRRTVRGGTDL
jgi:hypothetical protein